MQKITPFLWFDNNLDAALDLYTAHFKDAAILDSSRYGEAGPGTPGTLMTARFRLAGRDFIGLNGGPDHRFTPAVSYVVDCEDEAEIDALWAALGNGGMVLMELQPYPFAAKFGWLNDRFGLSWQLIQSGQPQAITPSLLFVGTQHGRAAEAIENYTALSPDSRVEHIDRYGPGEHEAEGTVRHAAFTLADVPFTAMDSGLEHQFTFTEANSFLINCDDQQEVDRYWEHLTDGGEPGPCGWLKDRFGVSWQVIPTILGQLLSDPDPARAQRATQAMFQMSKIDIAALQAAANDAHEA